jgi:hypothetical protein
MKYYITRYWLTRGVVEINDPDTDSLDDIDIEAFKTKEEACKCVYVLAKKHLKFLDKQRDVVIDILRNGVGVHYAD